MRRVLIGAMLTGAVVWGGLTAAPSAAGGHGECVQPSGGHHHPKPCPTTTTTTVPTTVTTQPTTTTTLPCTGNPETDESGCPIDDCALPPGNQPPECEPEIIPPVVLHNSEAATPVRAQPNTTG